MTKATNTLPNFLRAWRKKKGLTQERLAELAGFTPGAISQFETGTANVTVPSLVSLAGVLGCRPGDILSYSPDDISSKSNPDPETQLRLAMLAFGVDRNELGRAVSAVKLFLDGRDEQSSPDLPDDRFEPSTPRHAAKPSRKRPVPSGA